jgi:hypothetical protein
MEKKEGCKEGGKEVRKGRFVMGMLGRKFRKYAVKYCWGMQQKGMKLTMLKKQITERHKSAQVVISCDVK